jgi:hypothetical protein
MHTSHDNTAHITTTAPKPTPLSTLTTGIGDGDLAVVGDLEGLVVGAVFLGLLRHQAHVGHVAHGRHIELSIGETGHTV